MIAGLLYRLTAVVTLAAGLLILFGARPCAAAPLSADDLALIVNANEPASLELAQFYAKVRHVPDGRILQLNLPKAEAISFQTYDSQVLPIVRAWLHQPSLAGHVKCLVTFYGMPLRIDARINTPDESTEQQMLRQTMTSMPDRMLAEVQKLEAAVRQEVPTFQPGTGRALEALTARANTAMQAMRARVRQLPPGDQQEKAVVALMTALQPLVGDSARVAVLQAEASVGAVSSTQPAGTSSAATRPISAADIRGAQESFRRVLAEVAGLEQHRNDPAARQQMRMTVLGHLGLFAYVNLLSTQLDYLNTNDTASAVDSELALADWPIYTRVRWRENPLFYGVRRPPPFLTYRVMRLDAPTPELVHDLILAGMQVEEHGLKGQVVIDSRGLSPETGNANDRALAGYDGYLAELATLLRQHTHLQVTFDNKPAVLPAGSASDVALYCGWYSLRHYVPACKFNSGAVAYHIASFELLSLHNPGETGWVAGLLNDGVAATLGPVAEPYLQSFPRPDDFFPLLLTGRLPLADVYWATTPMTSWMQTMIGDPLYTPYRVNPPLQEDDLPQRLAAVLDRASNDR